MSRSRETTELQGPVRFVNQGCSDRSRATKTATRLIDGLMWIDPGWLKSVLFFFFAPIHCNPGCRITQIERCLNLERTVILTGLVCAAQTTLSGGRLGTTAAGSVTLLVTRWIVELIQNSWCHGFEL